MANSCDQDEPPEPAHYDGKSTVHDNGGLTGESVLVTAKDILAYYKSGCKKQKDVAIGMEVEKHGIYQASMKPVPYIGEKSVRKIQEKMIDELGWKASKTEDDFMLTLERCGSRLTLETGESMSELSGRTHPSIHDLARELEIHQHEESVISKIFGVLWLGIGIQPFAHNSQLKRLKTPRYLILYKYLENCGGLWEDELKKTASIQANIDYTSDADARKKFQILLRLSPFLSAMYAHSPLNNGELTGMASYRLHVLTHNDHDRFGIRKLFFENDFGFESWIDFCMDIPMISIQRNGKWIAVEKRTFRQFMKQGYEGFFPILNDWLVHCGFVYSFVRMKRYIEVRTCDSVPPVLIPSMQAIVKAFVYHRDGDRFLRNLTKAWTYEDFAGAYEKAAKHGMQAEVHGQPFLHYCKEILTIASDYLKSFKILNERHEDESVYLASIKDFVFVKEKSPGTFVGEQWEAGWKHNHERFIEWCRYD